MITALYPHTIHHTAEEKTTIIQDVRTDPTLPVQRTSDAPSARITRRSSSATTSEGCRSFSSSSRALTNGRTRVERSDPRHVEGSE